MGRYCRAEKVEVGIAISFETDDFVYSYVCEGLEKTTENKDEGQFGFKYDHTQSYGKIKFVFFYHKQNEGILN